MRKHIKKQLMDILDSLLMLHKELFGKSVFEIMESLQDCQNAAVVVGEALEKEAADIRNKGVKEEISKRENIVLTEQAVSLLEQYCEELFFISQEEVVSKERVDRLQQFIEQAAANVRNLCLTYQVVFFPYKAEMWDSLESIWLACREDSRCESIVVPIPYYRYDADKQETVCFYDGDKFPDYVPIVSYLEYSLQNELPEIAYIHNPYDRSNLVTSVHPAFYSDELKKYVEKLVYVPYYVTRGSISQGQSLLPVYLNMDYMVVQSEHFIKRNKHMFYYHKTLPLGSPKLDKIIRLCGEKKEHPETFEYPNGWKEVLKEKESLMLNTSLSYFLYHGEVYLQKLYSLFQWVKNSEDIVIIWRPHPLLEATIHSLRQELLPKYRDLVAYFENEKIGILDTTPDISRTVAIADGYIGEEDSSVVCLFGGAGKPQFLLNNYIYKDLEDSWNRRIRISDMVYSNGKYYMTSPIYNGLFSMEDNWEGIHFEGKVEGQPRWCESFPFLSVEDDTVFLSPRVAFEAAEYKVKEQEFKKAVPSNYYVEEKQFMSCRQVVSYKNTLFYLPEKNGVIWEYNKITEKWIEHRECMKYFRKGIEKEKYQSLSDTLDYVQNEHSLYIVAGYTNRVLCFDMESAKYEVYEVGDMEYGYSAITGSKEVFWLAEIQSGKVIKWNKKTGEILEVSMPKEYEIFARYDGSKYVHSRILETKEWIMTMPAFSKGMVKIDKFTGEATLCCSELWKDTDKPVNDYHPKFHMACCFAKKRDNEIIWMQRTRDDALIEFNVETGKYQIYYPTMTEEALNRLLDGEDGFERFNRDWYAFGRRESRVFSLEDFINDFKSGNLEEVREKQLKELDGFAANLDGTCGQKVHEFMMSILDNS